MGKRDKLIAELSAPDHFTRGPDRLPDCEIARRIASCLCCEEFLGSHCERDRGGVRATKTWLLRLTCSNPADCEWW